MSNPNTRKSCVVPKCTNTTTRTPEKIFFLVPMDYEMRAKWIKAMKRSDAFGAKSKVYCCEDHFEVEKDMENYIKHKLIGGRIKLRPGVVPHIFQCQEESVGEPNSDHSGRKNMIGDAITSKPKNSNDKKKKKKSSCRIKMDNQIKILITSVANYFNKHIQETASSSGENISAIKAASEATNVSEKIVQILLSQSQAKKNEEATLHKKKLKSEAKMMLLNVAKYFRKKRVELAISSGRQCLYISVTKKTSEATGVSMTTIRKILSQNYLDEDTPGSTTQNEVFCAEGVEEILENSDDEPPELEPERFIRCGWCDDVITGFLFVCVQCGTRACDSCDAQGQHAQHYVIRAPAGSAESEVEVVLNKVREGLAAAARAHSPADDAIARAAPMTHELEIEVVTKVKTEVDAEGDPLASVDYSDPLNAAPAGSQVVPELTEVKTEPPDTSPTRQETSYTDPATTSRHPLALTDEDYQPPVKRMNVSSETSRATSSMYPSHPPLQTMFLLPLPTPDIWLGSNLNAEPGFAPAPEIAPAPGFAADPEIPSQSKTDPHNLMKKE